MNWLKWPGFDWQDNNISLTPSDAKSDLDVYIYSFNPYAAGG